jgi:tetratricopeptide (TPR) repeat protein
MAGRHKIATLDARATGRSAADAADEALRLAAGDPRLARAKAAEALRLARAEHDRAAASSAERALGLAAREDHDLAAAAAHHRRAIRIAERAGLASHAARARVNLAAVLALRGDWTRALREIERAEPALDGHDLTLLQAQRAYLFHMRGRLREALEGYQRVMPAFRRANDTYREATTLNNRGLIHYHLGALAAAEADLARAERLFTDLGLERAAADIRENLGVVLVRRGRLAAALDWFDRADEYFRARGMVDAIGLRDRCHALLAARLVTEARQTAERAVRELAGRRMGAFLGDAQLLLAEAALLDGDMAAARLAAEQASRAFARRHLPSFLALARYTKVRVRLAGGERSPSLLRAARQSAAASAAAGWAIPALDARLVAARLAIDLGRVELARDELAEAGRARRSGPVELRSRAWHAVALLHLADGDRRGAERALRAGIRVLDRYRAALGATELRASAAGHAADLAHLGLGLAVRDGDARRAFAWAERWRAGSLQLRPARPPDDSALAAGLAELRRVADEMSEAARENQDIARLLARQAALEEAVRQQARHTPGGEPERIEAEVDLDRLTAALGERALVEILELDGVLHAVVVADGRVRLHHLGARATATEEIANLAFALRRLAHGGRPAASMAAAREAAGYAGERLDELLLRPLWRELGDRPLVVVPTGSLHALPWATLPSCAGRPVSVAPSAVLWLRAASADEPWTGARTVLVAGPGLPEAPAEVGELRGVYPDARALLGDEAHVRAVTDAMADADLAHVAAHGRFRADNPFFSSLQLADGPLTVYDLEALERAPSRLVLSACDSGLSAVRPGDELMGLAAALFMLGTRTLVASVVPIADAATREPMLSFHRALATGVEPATALAGIQARTAGGDDQAFAASVSFACFGTG